MSSDTPHALGLVLSFTYVLSFNVDMLPNSTVKNAKNANNASNATLLGFGNFPNPGLRPIHCAPGIPPPFGFRCINNDVETESPTPTGYLDTDTIPVPDPTPYPTPFPTASPTDTPGLETDVIVKPTASPSLSPPLYHAYSKYMLNSQNRDCTRSEVLYTYTNTSSGYQTKYDFVCEKRCDERRGDCIAIRWKKNVECILLKNSVCPGSPQTEESTGYEFWTRMNLYEELSGDCGGNHMDHLNVFAPNLATCRLKCDKNFPLCKGISYTEGNWGPDKKFKCIYKTSVCSNPTPGDWRFLRKIEDQWKLK